MERIDLRIFFGFYVRMQMTEQDNVMIITGSWVREDDGKWIFDALTDEGTKSITLRSGLE